MALFRKDPPPPPVVRPIRIHRLSPDYKRTLSSLQASAQVRQAGDADVPTNGPDGTGGGTRKWQREVWDYYDQVGPLHYAGTYVGNCLSRIRLTVALPDKEGVPGPVFDEDGIPTHPQAEEALALVRELSSFTAGQSQTMRALGLNSFIAGECYLLGVGEGAARQWEVLSVDELRPKRDKRPNGPRYERIDAPGANPVDVPADAVVFRIWTPHPRWSMLADAAGRALRDAFEEFVLLTREVRGQALSRLAGAGILIVPSEVDYPDDDNADENSEEGDSFTRDLIRTLSTAISDKATAAAVTPFVLRPGYDYADRIRHVAFVRPLDEKTIERRRETVMSIAQGVDLPVEVLTGHAQTTFSNAWAIDESLFKAHIEPKVQTLVDGLTVGYLRLALPGTELIVWYDPSALVIHPDRSVVATQAYDRRAISGSSYRGVLGFSESDAPDDAEKAERIGEALLLKGSGAYAPDPTGQVPGVGPATSGQATGIAAAAAEVSVLRAVDRAGARLRSKVNGSSLRGLLQNVPNGDVAATLGRDRVAGLVSDDELFKGEFNALAAWAARACPEDAAQLVAWAEGEARLRLYAPGARNGH